MQSNDTVQRHDTVQPHDTVNGPGTPWGRGPMIFRPNTPTAVKRGRLVFCALTLVAAAALIWPIYPRFATLEPMIAGLPFGMVWVIVVLIAMFVNILFLFRGDLRRGDLRRGDLRCEGPSEASRERDDGSG